MKLADGAGKVRAPTLLAAFEVPRAFGVTCHSYFPATPRVVNNPLGRVVLGDETLDYFRFAIGPQNIHTPARPGIFPRHESWSLLGHPPNMRLWRPGSRQSSCHNQADCYRRLASCHQPPGSGALSEQCAEPGWATLEPAILGLTSGLPRVAPGTRRRELPASSHRASRVCD
jgi:hypothetical protein